MAKIQRLIFVDANIWLDFYRARTDAGLRLLNHLEKISDKLVTTYQVEMEFKKNRQAAILEGIRELKAPDNIRSPGMLSDMKEAQALAKSIQQASARVKALKGRLSKALDDPTRNDKVYQACQRMFHKPDDLVLTRDNPIRRTIRRQAFRRFLHGCPPRKSSDTSIGDAINWEWMVYCAVKHKAELVIVTRDTDYGATLEGKSYINDHLRQEFSERVSKKRHLLLFTRLADALKHLSVIVTPQEIEEENRLVREIPAEKIESTTYERLLKIAEALTAEGRRRAPDRPESEPPDGVTK